MARRRANRVRHHTPLTSSPTAASAPRARPSGRPAAGLLQHERRRHALGDDRGVRLGRRLRVDRDVADVDDPRELADAIEEQPEVVERALRPAACTAISAYSGCCIGGCGVKRWIVRFDCVASPWTRRRMSATSFSSGSTCAQVLEPLLELGRPAPGTRQPARGRDAAGDVGAQRRQPRLPERRCRPASRRRRSSRTRTAAPAAHDDEGADLALPRKFAERQFHGYPVCLSVASARLTEPAHAPALPRRTRRRRRPCLGRRGPAGGGGGGGASGLLNVGLDRELDQVAGLRVWSAPGCR